MQLAQPKAVLFGVLLYWLSTLLGMPSLLVNAAYAPADQSKPVIVGFGLIFLALYALLGYKIYIGRDWARKTFAVLAILGLLMTFTTEPSNQHHEFVTYIFWVQTLLSVAALVLFYLPASRSWFSKQYA
jgi:hypothetical protein